MPKRQRKKLSLRYILAWVLFVTIWGSIVVVYLAESKLVRLVPGGWGESFSTKIYATPSSFHHESRYDLNEILERLQRANYQPGPFQNLTPGQYLWSDPILTISLRGFSIPHASQEPMVVKMVRWQKDRWHLKTQDEKILPLIMLEPEMIAELSGPLKVRREPAAWETFPPSLVNAVVSIEDKRFFTHHGVDFRSIGRAAWANIKHRKKLQGGSTITQQLAKNLFLTHRRTLSRKILEAFLAIYLDLRFSKQEILTLYLNHIYLGQDGFFSVAGVKAASQFYFGKDLANLDLSEAALIAGLIRSPYRYNPFQNPKRAKDRRNTVLKIMLENGTINETDMKRAAEVPLKLHKTSPNKNNSSENDYFIAEIVRRMLPRYSEDMLFRYGLRIHTTLDPIWQRKAHNAVKKTLYQAALICTEPETGRVICLIGGKNYGESQFNRATQAMRQPGSAFKPFVYGAALQSGFTPASLLEDKPRAYRDLKTKKIWAPQNFDGVFRGEITLRQALAQSINGATLDLAEKVGMSQIIYFARKLGFESTLSKDLSTALGAAEVVPLELTMAYAPFANGGFQVSPYFVTSVQDIEGNILELTSIERKTALDPALAYLMTSLMESTIKEGTAKALAAWGWTSPAAGKTGTTNEGKDAWFIGYTPHLLTGVWVGSDDATSINVTGAKDALPIWATFMNAVLELTPPEEFSRPQGLVTANIDPVSSALSRSGCPIRKNELFISGTEPKQYCPIHAGGFKGWLQKLFRKRVEGTEQGKSTE